MRSGTRDTRDRINMLRKHQANIQSLMVLKSYDLREIDKLQQYNHKEYTLCQLLLEVTSPLVTNKRNLAKLFFTVDHAASGADKDKGVLYLTYFNDRKELAAKVVDILPVFIDHMYGRNPASTWCHAAAMSIIQDITFPTDDDENDTGE
jgi:predicted site-specific integrase-resolvase